MPKGPSVVDSNGVATLEGKLRLVGGVTGEASDKPSGLSSQQADFECALTATVCMKIDNFMFSGAHIEGLNLNQRLP